MGTPAVLWLLVALVGAFARTGAAQQPEPAGRPRLALLVGVQHYQRTADGDALVPAPLHGVRNDIQAVKTTLRRHYGFEARDIEVLLDGEATHQRVVERFHAHLIAEADASTHAVFWFCGHGSRVPDRSGRESNKGMLADHGLPGAFDGSLVCFDSRAEATQNRDLVDDELYSLVRALAAKARHTLIVTDSCYSADVTRGGGVAGTRFQPPDTRPWDATWVQSIWPKNLPLVDDDDPRRTGDDAVGLRYAHIAASSNSQLAYERELPNGRRAGALTHSLTSLLREQRVRSWREVGLRARSLVAAEFPQTVWFEGQLDCSVFDSAFVPMPAGFATQVETDGRVLVEAGRLHGIDASTEVELVDLDGKAVGVARAESVAATSACFRLTGRDAVDLFDRALVARVRSGASGRAPLRLQQRAGVPADLLQDCPFAVFTADGTDGAIARTDHGTFELVDPAGYAARQLPADPLELRESLRKEHSYRALREFVAAPSQLAISLQVVPTRPEVLADLQEPAPAAQWRMFADGRAEVAAPIMDSKGGGGILTFRIENRAKVPVHVALLSVVEDRSVAVTWPPPDQRDRALRPGASVEAVVLVGPNRDWPLQRPMVDRYLAIATTSHADFRAFESSATLDALTATRGAQDDGLPPLLQVALRGSRTRGGTAGGGSADFGVAWLDVVLPAPARR